MASLSQLDYQSYRKKLLLPCPPPGHKSEPPKDTEAPLFLGRAFLFLINTRWFWGDEPGVENWPEGRRHWRERPRVGDNWDCALLQAHDPGTCLWSISSRGTLPLTPHPLPRMVLRVQRNHLGKALGPKAAKPMWEPKEMEMTWKSDSDSASTCLGDLVCCPLLLRMDGFFTDPGTLVSPAVSLGWYFAHWAVCKAGGIKWGQLAEGG